MPRLRTRQAIDCLQRALIGADPQEINIHLKLAKLHHDLGEERVAVDYHRHVVEVCRANSEFMPGSENALLKISTSCLCCPPKLLLPIVCCRALIGSFYRVPRALFRCRQTRL